MPTRHDPDARLRRLEWTVIRRLDGLLHGDYTTLFRGAGLDLADLREYQPYDDVRLIDWNVTARLQTPYVRQYHEEREITAWLLLDLSPSVDFGSAEVRKRAVVLDLVAVLARLLTRRGNRVGALCYRTRVEAIVPPGRGRTQVLQLLRVLDELPPPAERRATDLAELVGAAVRLLRRRSFVCLVSDFITPPGWLAPLRRLQARHEVLAVRVLDPLETALPDLGLLVVEDAETGEQLVVDTHDARFRARFAAAAERRAADLRAGLRGAAVDALELSTDDDLVEVIYRFAAARRQRRRLSAGGAAWPPHAVLQP